MSILKFSDFITEALGISDSLVSQAREFFEIINKDKSKMSFDVEYELNGKKQPLTIKLDRKFYVKGEFNPYTHPATITLMERTDLDTLTHELKHADRFFRIGLKAYKEDFTKLYSEAENKKQASLLPDKFRTLFFVFYFLQKEEFEAYFHSDYTTFLQQARVQGLRTHRELLTLWNNFDETSFKFYTGKMKPGKFTKRSIKMTIPEVQRPFKFSNWADEKTANLLIWLMLKEKHELTDDRLFKKVINLFMPNQIAEIIDNGYPKKYQTMIDKYRVNLEKVIDKRMDIYARKYSRILTITQSAI